MIILKSALPYTTERLFKIRSKHDQTCLDLAIVQNKPKCVQFFLEHYAAFLSPEMYSKAVATAANYYPSMSPLFSRPDQACAQYTGPGGNLSVSREAAAVPKFPQEIKASAMDDILQDVKQGNVRNIQLALISNPFFINTQHPSTGKTIVMVAVQHGQLKLLNLCCELAGHLIKWDLTDSGGNSVFVLAVRYKHHQALSLLIPFYNQYSRSTPLTEPQMIAPINCSEKQKSLLHWAVQDNYFEAIPVLYRFDNIDPNQVNAKGETPIVMAVSMSLLECVAALGATFSAQINLENHPHGNNVLTLATTEKDVDMVQILIESFPHLDVNAQTEPSQETVLHCAVRQNAPQIVAYLLKVPQMNQLILNQDGMTARQLAISLHHYSCVEQFEQLDNNNPSLESFHQLDNNSAHFNQLDNLDPDDFFTQKHLSSDQFSFAALNFPPHSSTPPLTTTTTTTSTTTTTTTTATTEAPPPAYEETVSSSSSWLTQNGLSSFQSNLVADAASSMSDHHRPSPLLQSSRPGSGLNNDSLPNHTEKPSPLTSPTNTDTNVTGSDPSLSAQPEPAQIGPPSVASTWGATFASITKAFLPKKMKEPLTQLPSSSKKPALLSSLNSSAHKKPVDVFHETVVNKPTIVCETTTDKNNDSSPNVIPETQDNVIPATQDFTPPDDVTDSKTGQEQLLPESSVDVSVVSFADVAPAAIAEAEAHAPICTPSDSPDDLELSHTNEQSFFAATSFDQSSFIPTIPTTAGMNPTIELEPNGQELQSNVAEFLSQPHLIFDPFESSSIDIAVAAAMAIKPPRPQLLSVITAAKSSQCESTTVPSLTTTATTTAPLPTTTTAPLPTTTTTPLPTTTTAPLPTTTTATTTLLIPSKVENNDGLISKPTLRPSVAVYHHNTRQFGQSSTATGPDLIIAWESLLSAARQGQAPQVLSLLQRYPHIEVNRQDKSGKSPLMYAAIGGHTDVIVALGSAIAAAHNVNPNIVEYQDGLTALMYAVIYNRIESIVALHQNFPSIHPNQTNFNGESALIIAARLGHPRCMETLYIAFEKKLNLNQVDAQGLSALAHTVFSNRLSAFIALMSLCPDHTMNINGTDSQGYTPLMLASQSGHDTLVETLCQFLDLDVNYSQPKTGWTALVAAASAGHTGCISALRRFGVDPNHTTKEGATALIYAVENGHIECVKELLQIPTIRIDTTLPGSHWDAMTFAQFNHDDECVALLQAHIHTSPL